MATITRPSYAALKAVYRADKVEAAAKAVTFKTGSTAYYLWIQESQRLASEIQRVEAAEQFGRPYCPPTTWTIETAVASWYWREVARFLTLYPGSDALVSRCMDAIHWDRSEAVLEPMHSELASEVTKFLEPMAAGSVK